MLCLLLHSSLLVPLGINLSQQPDLLQLQKRLYQQLHVDDDEMPSKAKSIEAQLDQLTQLCSNRVVLCVLGKGFVKCFGKGFVKCFASRQLNSILM